MKILLSIAILLFTNTIAYCNENKTYELLEVPILSKEITELFEERIKEIGV